MRAAPGFDCRLGSGNRWVSKTLKRGSIPRQPASGVTSSVAERPAVNRKTRVRFPVTPQLAVAEMARRRTANLRMWVQVPPASPSGCSSVCAEYSPWKRVAVGSNPTTQTNWRLQGPSMARLAGCKPVALVSFGGSTPSPCTKQRVAGVCGGMLGFQPMRTGFDSLAAHQSSGIGDMLEKKNSWVTGVGTSPGS